MTRPRRQDESGFTLVEMLVALTLFSVLLALFTSATTMMYQSVRRQQGLADDADGARRVLQLLDKQVRYANGINTPGTTADGSTWVEWRQGNHDQQQTCVQWRLTAAGDMQFRTWAPPLVAAVPPVAVTPGPWSTRASRLLPPATGSVFALGSTVGNGDGVRQQLTVAFRTAYGRPVVQRASQVTLTALNTPTPTPPSPAVCQEVPRS